MLKVSKLNLFFLTIQMTCSSHMEPSACFFEKSLRRDDRSADHSSPPQVYQNKWNTSTSKA